MTPTHSANRTRPEGIYFGVPLGDLGWFQSVLMAIGIGLLAFCAATFVAIIGTLIYSIAAHHPVDFAVSYKRIGFPIGLGVMVASLSFFGYLWVKRVFLRH